MNLLQTIEQKHISELTTNAPIVDFKAGDTVVVTTTRVKEIKSAKKGKQAEIRTHQERTTGTVISKVNRGIGSSFTVRSIVNNMQFLTKFPLHGTKVEKLDEGVMRQAKPYYLLKLRGKKAKIESRRDYMSRKKIARTDTAAK